MRRHGAAVNGGWLQEPMRPYTTTVHVHFNKRAA